MNCKADKPRIRLSGGKWVRVPVIQSGPFNAAIAANNVAAHIFCFIMNTREGRL